MKVLVIDDHTLFRSGLSGLLEQRGIEVAAVGSGEEGLAALGDEGADIVLLDLRMPEMGGLEVLRQVRKTRPEVPVAMLTTSAEERDLVESLRLGARGYLLKDADPEELVSALEAIAAGETVVAPDLAGVLAEAVRSGGDGPGPGDSLPDLLTARELEVLQHVAKGQSNKEIGRDLGITDGTVKLHVKSILRKLNVHSRVAAAVMATEEGLG